MAFPIDIPFPDPFASEVLALDGKESEAGTAFRVAMAVVDESLDTLTSKSLFVFSLVFELLDLVVFLSLSFKFSLMF